MNKTLEQVLTVLEDRELLRPNEIDEDTAVDLAVALDSCGKDHRFGGSWAWAAERLRLSSKKVSRVLPVSKPSVDHYTEVLAARLDLLSPSNFPLVVEKQHKYSQITVIKDGMLKIQREDIPKGRTTTAVLELLAAMIVHKIPPHAYYILPTAQEKEIWGNKVNWWVRCLADTLLSFNFSLITLCLQDTLQWANDYQYRLAKGYYLDHAAQDKLKR